MIKADFGKLSIKGNKPLIMAELGSLINGLYRREILTKKELETIFKESFKTGKEIEEEFRKKYKDGMSTSEIQNMIAQLIEAKESGKTNDEEEIDEPKIETIVDNDNLKVTKVSLNGKGKSKEEIGEIIKKLLEEGDIIDGI